MSRVSSVRACVLPADALCLSCRSYEKRHKNVPAHLSPCFRVKEGDKVVVGQCRPLSKTVRFNVLKVIPMGSKMGAKGGGKSFAAF
jgi:small subunit ribosomal protein S11e